MFNTKEKKEKGARKDQVILKSFNLSTAQSGTGGFTLVEMIVSLAIFAVVAVVALGALIKIIDANNKAQTLQSAMTNVSFGLETMSRELRVGTEYDCQNSSSASVPSSLSSVTACTGLDQTPSGALIAFNSSSMDNASVPPCNLIYAYQFIQDPNNSSAWIINKAQQVRCGSDNANTIGDASSPFEPILDPSVIITGYHLQVSGGTYPMVFLSLTGYSGVAERQKSYFDVQTAISSRTRQ
jgi:prepilin-type N-terminal cleavage/methylation domain-containing protein